MTAVEFIFEELENRENGSPHFTMQQIYNKAKEMEKQQIIEFTSDFIDEYTYGDYDGDVQKSKRIEEYYNETYENI